MMQFRERSWRALCEGRVEKNDQCRRENIICASDKVESVHIKSEGASLLNWRVVTTVASGRASRMRLILYWTPTVRIDEGKLQVKAK